jgi:serine/threonine-protein kinase HipA
MGRRLMRGRVEVKLWGTTIGYLGYAPGQNEIATFEYTEAFIRSNIFPSPLMMHYPPSRFSFPDISLRTFKGVAGIFADSLPDKYGNQLIDIFMAEKKIAPESITPLDRLLYVGTRGMGALEYHPSEFDDAHQEANNALDIHLLSGLAQRVLSKKESLHVSLQKAQTKKDALNLIRVGSSAGGARAKALVARDTKGNFYDGTMDHGTSHSYWLLKFDSAQNSDRDSNDPKGMPKVEYIYAQLAKECGIDMPEVEYIQDGEDFHFLIKRFDRDTRSSKLQKVHYASWSGLAHADRDATGAYSYEQLILTARQLGLGQDAITELYRRAVFNIVGRNQDDHTKNFGFLMDKTGTWKLAPAFDMTYAYDPTGKWTRSHQIKLSGKQEDFLREDVIKFGAYCNLSAKKAQTIFDEVISAFQLFEVKAKALEVEPLLRETICQNLRLTW